jgi:hypothetical protein
VSSVEHLHSWFGQSVAVAELRQLGITAQAVTAARELIGRDGPKFVTL